MISWSYRRAGFATFQPIQELAQIVRASVIDGMGKVSFS